MVKGGVTIEPSFDAKPDFGFSSTRSGPFCPQSGSVFEGMNLSDGLPSKVSFDVA